MGNARLGSGISKECARVQQRRDLFLVYACSLLFLRHGVWPETRGMRAEEHTYFLVGWH